MKSLSQLIACHVSLATILQDLRYGLRQLARNPGFATTAVMILALGIGINTSIFSMLNAVLLRSLPVPDPHELRVINWVGKTEGNLNYCGMSTHLSSDLSAHGSFSYPVYKNFFENNAYFSDLFAFCSLGGVSFAARNDVLSVDGAMVSGNFFSGLRVSAAMGRVLRSEDDRANAEPVAVITYRYWENRFSSDPNILGYTVSLNKKSFTIIGVLKRDFVGPINGDPADFYVPIAMQPHFLPQFSLNSSRDWWLEIGGRLLPGVSDAQALSLLDVLFQRYVGAENIEIDRPSISLEDGSRGVLMNRRYFAKPLLALLMVVGLVLLIACINLSSLLLVRDVGRRREMAIRAAIGAGRWRLIRQSLTENLVLSFAGTAVGLVFSEWCKSVLWGFFFSPENFHRALHFDIRTDAQVLAFSIALTIFTTLLFGVLPAFRASQFDPAKDLKDQSARSAPRLRLGKMLVSLQVGLSVILVMGAGLTIRTFVNLCRVDPGFNSENLLLFHLDAEKSGYMDQERVHFFEKAKQSIAALPGVRGAALSQLAPGEGMRWSRSISIPGRSDDPSVWMMFVSDSYFQTIGINLLRGRDFSASDNGDAPRVAIVNERFVRDFYPKDDPLGRSFQSGQNEYRIVGVCRDAVYESLRNESPPTMYFSYRQESPGSMCFMVRSIVPPLSLVPVMRKAVADIDSTIPLTTIMTQQQCLNGSIAQERFFALLGGFLAMLAMLLSCIGLYGLMAYTVKRRTSEIGVRMALGARPRDVALPIVWEAFRLAAAGVVVGAPVAIGSTHFIRSVLYGIQPYDPATLIGGSLLLIGVAVLSAWLPARRAAKVDPMTALRCE